MTLASTCQGGDLHTYPTRWIDPKDKKRGTANLTDPSTSEVLIHGTALYTGSPGHPSSARMPRVTAPPSAPFPLAAMTSSSARCLSVVSSKDRWTWLVGALWRRPKSRCSATALSATHAAGGLEVQLGADQRVEAAERVDVLDHLVFVGDAAEHLVGVLAQVGLEALRRVSSGGCSVPRSSTRAGVLTTSTSLWDLPSQSGPLECLLDRVRVFTMPRPCCCNRMVSAVRADKPAGRPSGGRATTGSGDPSAAPV
jgi:hypothetical protein